MKLLDVITSPWAITRDKLNEIQDIYSAHLKREKIDFKALEAETGVVFKGTDQEMLVIDDVAIIPIQGVLGKKMNMFSRISGGSSMQIIENQVAEAVKSDDIKAIILDIDSPGGTVDGSSELANKIYSLRGKKPIIAFASGMMASAAVWIGSAADKVFISGETTMTGSVGVIATHVDVSKAEEKAGFRTTEVVSGKFKAINTQHKPLSKEGKQVMQDLVDSLLGAFVSDIAKFKGKSVDEITNSVGEAQTFVGSEGIAAGLVDGVSTFEALIEKLSGGDGDLLPSNNPPTEGKKAMEENKTKIVAITAEGLKADHPEVFKAIGEQAVEASRKEIFANGYSQGQEDERQRIQEVEAQNLPGHEKLIESLKFDGKTSGAEAAMKVLQAEREVGKNKALEMVSEAPDAVEDFETKPKKRKKVEVAQELTEEGAKAEWESNSEIRAEYPNFKAYYGYLKYQKSLDR